LSLSKPTTWSTRTPHPWGNEGCLFRPLRTRGVPGTPGHHAFSQSVYRPLPPGAVLPPLREPPDARGRRGAPPRRTLRRRPPRGQAPCRGTGHGTTLFPSSSLWYRCWCSALFQKLIFLAHTQTQSQFPIFFPKCRGTIRIPSVCRFYPIFAPLASDSHDDAATPSEALPPLCDNHFPRHGPEPPKRPRPAPPPNPPNAPAVSHIVQSARSNKP